MSYGKDETKGKSSNSNSSSSSSSNSPAPLPMYQRVVLKHVPTMVRRRYDSDLDNLIQDLPSEDSNSEDDGVEDVIPDFAANDVDDGSGDKVEDDGQSDDPAIGKCITNQDTQTCTEDFGLSMSMEDNKREADGPEDVNLPSSLEAIDANRNQKNGPAKYDNVQGSDVEDNRWDSNGAAAVDIVCYSEDEVAENELELRFPDNKQGLLVENCKSEGEEIKYVNVANYCVNDSEKDDSEKDENFDDKQGVLLEDSKSHKEAASYEDASVNIMDVQDEELETEPLTVMEDSVTMTFGKNAKKENHSPPPLPMYQRVTLKHVPTMVRRRYDKALHKFDASEGGTSDDGSESNSDTTEYANPASTLREMDNSNGYDAEDVTKTSNTLANSDINDAQTYTEDFCGNDFEPSASMHLEVGKSENDGAEVANLFSSVDDDGKDIIQVNGHEKTDSKAMYSEDGKSENDAAEEVNLFSSVDDDEKDIIPVKGNEKSDSDEGIYLEDAKGANDGAEQVDFSSSVDYNGKDIIQVNGHAKSESDEASCSKDCTSEDDEAKKVNFTDCVNATVDKEVQDNELDLESSCVGDSAEDEVQGKIHGSSDKNHGLHIEHCKSKGDGSDAATYYVDGCVKDEVQEKGVNFDSKCDLPVQNVESQGNGTGDKYLATAKDGMKDHGQKVKDSYCEHGDDFNPEAFKKTLAQDGYELCCPNCKRYITETMILRRKKNSQQCQTTCFSCITALFRCIQW